MTGGKVISIAVGIGVGYGVGTWQDSIFLGLALGGLAGYMAPTLWLKSRIKANQLALTYGLADALDLMVVCVEADSPSMPPCSGSAWIWPWPIRRWLAN